MSAILFLLHYDLICKGWIKITATRIATPHKCYPHQQEWLQSDRTIYEYNI